MATYLSTNEAPLRGAFANRVSAAHKSTRPVARDISERMSSVLWRERIRYFRMLPFDVATEAGRAAERQRRILLTALAGLAGKALSVALTLLTVPLTIEYLGHERYGLWLAISSVVGMMSFLDLGIGNGLLTKVADADGRGQVAAMSVLVSSAFVVLVMIASALSLILLISAPHLRWADLLGVTSPDARNEIRPVFICLLLVFCGSMPLAVVQRVQSGLQCGHATTLWGMAGTIGSLVGLLIATSLHAGLVALVLAISGIPALVTLLNFVLFFFRQRPDIRPRLASFEWHTAGALVRTGVMFVLLQLAMAFAFVSDNLVVARTLGASAVPTLAVPAKLTQLLVLPSTLVVVPLWAAYGEANARGDTRWVARTLHRSIVTCVGLAAVGAAGLVAFGPWIVRIWSRGIVEVGRDVTVPLALWTCLQAWGIATSAFLNSTNRIREQALCAVLMATSAFGLKWKLVFPFGPGGVAWATVISYFVFTFVPLALLVHRVKKRLALVADERQKAVSANPQTTSEGRNSL